MRRLLFATVVLAASVPAFVAASMQPSIVTAELPRSVQVTHSQVTLHDLVQFDAAQSPCARQLAAQPLMMLSTPNAPRLLRREEIVATIASSPLTKECTVQLHGSDTTMVLLKGTPADIADLRRQAATVLSEALSQRYKNVDVVAVNTEQSSLEVASGTEFKIQPPAVDRPYRRMAVDVLVQPPSGSPAWKYSIWFDVHASASVLRVNSALRTGSVISDTSIRHELVDVTEIAGEPLPDDFDFHGYTGKVPLHKGDVLTRENVTRAPDVAAGQPVSLQYQSNAIRIEVAATALQSGFAGDRVRVRNIRSDEDVVGLVGGPGIVKVIP
jgi:flagella basal body P-ring formation protein FlgA